jgi:protocatechuate 3,4-dioxygenase beta subunit
MNSVKRNQSNQGYSRRDLFRVLGLGTVAVLVDDNPLSSIWHESVRLPPAFAATTFPACVVRPEQTEGPYFVEEKLHRSDIRVDPSDKSLRSGVPLRLEFQVSRITTGGCAPLSGAVVDIWHCDAQGVYSDVRDPRFDTRGKKFLRGYQQADANGRAVFQTIYPGWYEGRAVHIHFKIRRSLDSQGAQEFTSQLYFDEAVTDQVFKAAPYSGKRGRRVANDADFIFRRGGKDLLLAPVKEAAGYAATFSIGLQSS